MNPDTSTLLPDDPRWAQARGAAVGLALRITAAHIRQGQPGFHGDVYREGFSNFLAEGLARGQVDVYKAALDGAAEVGIAHLENNRPAYASLNSVLEEAHAQVKWAMTPPAPLPQPMSTQEWLSSRGIPADSPSPARRPPSTR